MIAYILSLQNFLWRFPAIFVTEINMGQIMAHTWTLCIEVWMGILWTFILKRVPRKNWRAVCVIGIVFAISWRIFILCGAHHKAWIYNMPFAYTDIFALGTFLALDRFEEKNSNMKAFVISGLGALGIAGVWIYLAVVNSRNFAGAYLLFGGSGYYLSSIFTVNVYLYLALFFYGIIYLVLRWKPKRWWRALVVLGDYSYELYLYHYPFLVILVQIGKWGDWKRNFLVCFIGAVLCTIVWTLANKSLRKDRRIINDTFV